MISLFLLEPSSPLSQEQTCPCFLPRGMLHSTSERQFVVILPAPHLLGHQPYQVLCAFPAISSSSARTAPRPGSELGVAAGGLTLTAVVPVVSDQSPSLRSPSSLVPPSYSSFVLFKMQAYLITMLSYQKWLPIGFRRKIKALDVACKTLHDLVLTCFLLLSELLPCWRSLPAPDTTGLLRWDSRGCRVPFWEADKPSIRRCRSISLQRDGQLSI